MKNPAVAAPRMPPPVYRPQGCANPAGVQRFTGAPPVYRPNVKAPAATPSKPAPGPPPVYRPPAPLGAVPPVYRPHERINQAKCGCHDLVPGACHCGTKRRAAVDQQPQPNRLLSPAAMQRKILVVQPEPPVGASLKQQGSYETVLKSAEALKSRLAAKGTTEVILKENEITAASLANVLGTEKIYIIGHGDGKLVGRKTPEQLAKLLITTGGLTQAKAITVLACLSYYTEQRTGSGDIVEDETYTKKLVLEIRKILGNDASALRGINVKGRTGFVHINEKLPSTRVRGTTPEQVKTILGNYSECGKEYNDLLEEYGQHTDPAQADEWAYSAYKACMVGKGKDKSIKVYDAKAPESFRRIAI